MPPVRRHRIGDQRPSVIHPDPDPAAISLCRDLAATTDAEAVVLFGSRAVGGWDERSDLDVIIVHPSSGGHEAETAIRRVLHRIRERHYPGCWDHESPHRGVRGGQQVVSLDYYASYRRTMNDVMARAAREGCIFTREPNAADRFRHDGNVSNEWELVTLERLNRAVHVLQNIVFMRGNARWYAEGDPPSRRHRLNVHTDQGREAHELLWNSGAALLSILGVIYPRTRWRRWPLPSPGTTPAGATPSGATWNASTSTPIAAARWWSPTPSTTCQPCGEISKVTVSPCGNGSAHSAVTTSLKRSRPQIRKLDRPPPMPEMTVRYSKPPDRRRRKS